MAFFKLFNIVHGKKWQTCPLKDPLIARFSLIKSNIAELEISIKFLSKWAKVTA